MIGKYLKPASLLGHTFRRHNAGHFRKKLTCVDVLFIFRKNMIDSTNIEFMEE